MHPCEQVGDGIFAIDTEFVRPRLDACHLVIDAGRAAFIDAGTHLSVPRLLAALSALDVGVECVDFVMLTHVHLDHAGGAGRLVAALPTAKVLVHPSGAMHVLDPSVLVAATKAVYGEDQFVRQYGDVMGIAAERIVAVEDGRRERVGRRTFELFHTPGHALHHLCIADREAGEVFAGDTFGLSYRELDTQAGEFIFPTTSPSQFDPVQLHASIDRIVNYRPSSVYLTHYSRVGHVDELAAILHRDIDVFVAIALRAAHLPDRVEHMKPALFDHLSGRLDAHGYTGGAALRHEVLDGDVALNAAGLHSWLNRCRR
ncbi:MAG: MBL fold metallo-hydrolase [Pseudomonadota bacterium]|nr:MBL fold metallo-hydrolase [Pseudomonadota bacterium]